MTKTTMPTTNKLSATQHLVLASACAHADSLATRPPHLRPAQAAKVLAALVGAGLIREVRAKAEMPVWRHDEQGRPMAVKIMKAGRTALTEALPADAASPAACPSAEAALCNGTASSAADGTATVDRTADTSGTARPAPESKRTLILALMRREGGATMEELTAATGWLPHTTRAALSGLRKGGIAVGLAKGQRGAASTYRVEAAPVAAAA